MTKDRTIAIDLLRGFIMILMAVDHASAMIARVHFTEIWGLEFKAYPDLAWWFTRFISHLCAPGFFFLMGMSMILFAFKRQQEGWSIQAIRKYFLKRGSIILLLMLFLEFPAWLLSSVFSQMPPDGMTTLPGIRDGGFLIPSTVLFGLGACMMLGSFLWKLKKEWFLLITIVLFGLSTWLIPQYSATDNINTFLSFICVPGLSEYGMCIYPIIPWLGITTLGMFFAKLLNQRGHKTYQWALFTGIVFITLFLVLRYLEWGNFHKNSYDDWISFFTLIKYPPSILFALITIGLNLIIFYIFSTMKDSKRLKPIKVFGQTAMFFYILHLYTYALMGSIFPLGTSIGMMYLCWLIGLVLLYFICNWFLRFKHQKSANSLWRMI